MLLNLLFSKHTIALTKRIKNAHNCCADLSKKISIVHTKTKRNILRTAKNNKDASLFFQAGISLINEKSNLKLTLPLSSFHDEMISFNERGFLESLRENDPSVELSLYYSLLWQQFYRIVGIITALSFFLVITYAASPNTPFEQILMLTLGTIIKLSPLCVIYACMSAIQRKKKMFKLIGFYSHILGDVECDVMLSVDVLMTRNQFAIFLP